jgi:60 kDa SS-A/Ro ribonucleoprotein
VAQVVDALDEAFYLAFGNVEPTGKRTMLALDVSGSMGAALSGMPLSCREGAAAMALVTARVEPRHVFTVFSAGGTNHKRLGSGRGWATPGISTWAVSPRQRLDDVVKTMAALPFDGTDCALPMLYALDQGMPIDTFIVYTDNETWAGDIHPFQALEMYRQKTGIPAKLVVAGMVSNGFSIANPDDGGMLDVVGFDMATPQVISDFAK